MDAITVQQTDAVNQMDLDFRLNLFPGSIKKTMQFGNQDVVKAGEKPRNSVLAISGTSTLVSSK